jgi:hypothetical protein
MKDREVWPVSMSVDLCDKVRDASKRRADETRMNVSFSAMARYLIERGLAEYNRKRK